MDEAREGREKKQEGRGEAMEKKRAEMQTIEVGTRLGCRDRQRGRSKDDRGGGQRRGDVSSRRLTPF